ncbi:hypothetical protein, partial [Staphylococcus aureus]|uniref:hypothetical protein n=1 Tax=Staphylococcus aureus TaxID=1280 RepID=UPI0039BE1BFC
FWAFTFTTPYQLALLLFAWIILLLPLSERGAWRWLVWVFVVAACLIHPLSGAAAFGLVAGYACLRRLKPGIALPVTVLLNASLIPMMLVVDAHRRGAAWPRFSQLSANTGSLLGLFSNPYPHPPGAPFLGWDALYAA